MTDAENTGRERVGVRYIPHEYFSRGFVLGGAICLVLLVITEIKPEAAASIVFGLGIVLFGLSKRYHHTGCDCNG